MTKPTYWELLRDPRWQRRRLEVMQRAGFACEECRDQRTTLNVHHTHYVKGRAPWEYLDHELKCLCEPCHKQAESEIAEIRESVGQASMICRRNIIGYARAKAFFNDMDRLYSVAVEDNYVAAGIAAAFSVRTSDVKDLVIAGRVDLFVLWDRSCSAPTPEAKMRQAELNQLLGYNQDDFDDFINEDPSEEEARQ